MITRVVRTTNAVKAAFSKSVSCISIDRNSVRHPMCSEVSSVPSGLMGGGGGGLNLTLCLFYFFDDFVSLIFFHGIFHFDNQI